MFDVRGIGAAVAFWMVVTLNAGASQNASLPDPTEPPLASSGQTTVSPASRFSLDSILVGEERRRAVINGTTLASGSRLGAARVLRIGVDRVLIEINGKQYTLELEGAPSIRR